MTRTDPRILATARLVENLAELVPTVRDHVREQLHLIDSFGDHTPGASPATGTRREAGSDTCHGALSLEPGIVIICGSRRPCPEHDRPVTLTPVERAAEQRMQLNNWLNDIEAHCKAIAHMAADALNNGRKLIGNRVALPAQCRDGGIGKQLTPELAADIAVCLKIPHKTGLCTAHYMRWWRERRDGGRDVSDMHEPGAA